MATVGINFGSATSGAGFDVTTTVASIIANLKVVEAPWTDQLASLKAQDTAFTSIGSDLATLSTSLQALTDFQGVTASKLGSSSDSNILSLGAAGPTATSGSHTVIVSQLAQASSQYSDPLPAADILSGALTIKVGTGTATTIPAIAGTSDTLSTYASAINLAGIGVTASVISDTSGSRLAIVSNSSGAASQLTITAGGSTVATTQPTAAASALAPSATGAATSTFTLPTSTSQLSGTFSYAIGGNGYSGTVSLGSTPLSLDDSATALNSDTGFIAAGLVASVSGSSLTIVGGTDSTGTAAIITTGSSLTTTTLPATYGALADTTSSTFVKLHSALAGQDAKLNVDGLSVDSASNTISTAIPGVSFQILSADPSTTVQVQIANNSSGVETAFSTFITAYNAVVKDISAQEGNDTSGHSEPLFGNTVISQLQSSLSLALTTGAASGSVKSLYQLGISVKQDGTLALDTTALDRELSSNYSDVVGFMQNDQSFGLTFQNSLDQLGSQSPTGAITLALANNNRQETLYNNDVTAQDNLISKQQLALTSELNSANEILQAIPQQLNEVNELYSALTGYNTTKG